MTAAAGTATVELDDVTAYRAETLVKAGFSLDDALLLADRGEVDLHTAVFLAESGCPTETALRILL